MEFIVSNTNVHIEDSWRVSKTIMESELRFIRLNQPNSQVWLRSLHSLKMEWCTHNLLYALGIKRCHTVDVDLNYPQEWYVKLIYAVVGPIAYLFIK